MTNFSNVLSALEELQSTCPKISQMLTQSRRKLRTPKTISFLHTHRSNGDPAKGASILFGGAPRWGGYTSRLSNHQKIEFFGLETRSMSAWMSLVGEIRSSHAYALEGAKIFLQQHVDQTRDDLTTFELAISGFDVSGNSERSDFTPRGLTQKLRKFLEAPDKLDIASSDAWLVRGKIIRADTAEKALLLWAIWADEDIDAILRKNKAPVVAKVVPEEGLLAEARKLRKKALET